MNENKKKPKKHLNSEMMKTLGINPIAFNPIFAYVSKSATSGLFMSQMQYWSDKGKKGKWFYKTIAEMKLETGLTRAQQNTAILFWKDCGAIEMKNRGLPRRRFFKLDPERLFLIASEGKRSFPVKKKKTVKNLTLKECLDNKKRELNNNNAVFDTP